MYFLRYTLNFKLYSHTTTENITRLFDDNNVKSLSDLAIGQLICENNLESVIWDATSLTRKKTG